MEATQIKKTVIKNLLEVVYLPDWGTHAYICKDGTITIQLIWGEQVTKKEFLKHFKEGGYPNFLRGFWNKKERQDFIDRRMKLFDDLQDYYNKIKDASR